MDVKELMKDKIVKDIADKKELVWINPKKVEYREFEKNLPISDEELEAAENRVNRFAPFIAKAFPETAVTKGILESPLAPMFNMQKKLEETYGIEIPGKLYLKMDSHLPVAGSIKARGGFYEVFKHAEELALENGILKLDDDYSILADEKSKEFFSKYKVQVGSTGNLGLSIGISSAALGFEAIVHMSGDAKQWKKDKLRSKGVKVVEYDSDFLAAVEGGRKSSAADPMSYFVDDEKSMNLFLGYTVAGKRLQKQFDQMGIVVDKEHPLFVYLPCGVGGSPGGVTYALKRIFKENVHAFFIEPTLAPCMILGMETGLHDGIAVKDVGITGMTHSDGLAVGRSSEHVGEIMDSILSGIFTMDDYKLYDYLRILDSTEHKRIEPCSCSAFEGPVQLMKNEATRKYVEENVGENIKNATHICWATGGSMVPEKDMEEFLKIHLK